MDDYAVWLYELLASVIREQTPEQTSRYIIEHFDVIRRCVVETISPESQRTAGAVAGTFSDRAGTCGGRYHCAVIRRCVLSVYAGQPGKRTLLRRDGEKTAGLFQHLSAADPSERTNRCLCRRRGRDTGRADVRPHSSRTGHGREAGRRENRVLYQGTARKAVDGTPHPRLCAGRPRERRI